MKSFLITAILSAFWMFALPVSAADLIGQWTLNAEETAKKQPEQKRAKVTQRGFGTTVGGVPIPPSQSGSPVPSGTISKPVVLTCENLNIEKDGNEIYVTCDDLPTRVFKIGNLHGRLTKWNEDRLTERYEAVSRRVSHDFRLLNKNTLRIEVRIKPQRQSAQRYILIFDRVVELGTQS